MATATDRFMPIAKGRKRPEADVHSGEVNLFLFVPNAYLHPLRNCGLVQEASPAQSCRVAIELLGEVKTAAIRGTAQTMGRARC